jgi:hypothetical protein
LNQRVGCVGWGTDPKSFDCHAALFVVPALMPMAAWLGAHLGMPSLMAWFPLFFLFVLLPVADYALGHDPRNLDAEATITLEQDGWFKCMTFAALPAQLGVLAWSGWHFVHAGFDVFGMLGWLLSQGIVGGVLAINVAHELIHKDTALERTAGGVLLTSVGYHGFKIEHVRGHHVHVSTPEDASSARYGQSLWHFLPRALVRNTANAWKLETLRLEKRGKRWWSVKNELVRWSLLWLVLAVAFTSWLGPVGLAFFLAQGLFAACSLEITTTSSTTDWNVASWSQAATSARPTCIRGIRITCSATCCCSTCSDIPTTTKPRGVATRCCCTMPTAHNSPAATPACSCSRCVRRYGFAS